MSFIALYNVEDSGAQVLLSSIFKKYNDRLIPQKK